MPENHIGTCTIREDVHGTVRPEACPFCVPFRAAVQECAEAIEGMVVGGRQWTEEQAVAADALFAAANGLRERFGLKKVTPSGGAVDA